MSGSRQGATQVAPESGNVMESSWILVGVDGSPASLAAVEYATVEAWRSDATLHLVHVIRDYGPFVTGYPTMVPMTSAESRRIGHSILRAASEKAGQHLSPDRVSSDLMTGDRAASLVYASRGAALVVLGDHRRSAVDWIVTGSVIGAVAAHAAAPVVAVPSDWAPINDHRHVVAAVKSWDTSLGLVRRALDVAVERRVGLVLLHAWQMPTGYDDIIVARVDAAEIEHAARRALERLVELAAEERPGHEPGVPVDIQVVHGQPTRMLVDASKTAGLIMITRRPHAFPMGHLGGAGRSLLREAQCPVEVLPPDSGSVPVSEALVPDRAEQPDLAPEPT